MLDQLSQRSPNTGITKSAMFRSQLLWRLYAGYVAIILCCTLIVGVLVGRQVTENGMRDIQQSLVVRSKLLAQVAKPTLLALAVDSLATAGSQSGTSNNTPGEALQDIVVQLGRDTHSRLSVIDVEGRVIADSMQSPELMDNHARRPEIIAAWDEGAATAAAASAVRATVQGRKIQSRCMTRVITAQAAMLPSTMAMVVAARPTSPNSIR